MISMTNRRARVIAFYLPQFHPTPENDKNWGKGFTEWLNVARAKPLFRGHEQPKLPADLGFYDLRLPVIREQQAELAREAGIEGFMYWHYWFGDGVMTLQDIFEDVLAKGKPDLPFCLGWANHSWTNKSWTKGSALQKDSMIFEMKYPGESDYVKHFEYCLPAFKDKRYITVNGKPLFFIFSPYTMPDVKDFISAWRRLAIENGLSGIHFVAYRTKNEDMDKIRSWGFDAIDNCHQYHAENHSASFWLWKKTRGFLIKQTHGLVGLLRKYNYAKIINYLSVPDEDSLPDVYPTIISGYDRSPRSGREAIIYYNYTPDLFKKHVAQIINSVSNKPEEERIVFLKSWNEWAEGNYVEPDTKYGKGYINALREILKSEE